MRTVTPWLRARDYALEQLINPWAETELNERQPDILALSAKGEELTSRRCKEVLRVTGPTIAADFSLPFDRNDNLSPIPGNPCQR